MAGDNQQFCLRWNNHQSTLISVFDSLLESGTLVDCTLAAEGQYLKAHKVVLSACSPYLELLLSQHYEKHPIVILKDVKFQELKSMMDYMYRGEVNITQDQLATFLKAAESLQIKGLSESSGDDARDVGSTAKRPREEPPPRRQVNPHPQARLPHSSGLTIEPRRSIPHSSDKAPESPMRSREGSTSPVARKRRRRRPSTGEDASNAALSDSQLETSNSCDLPPISNQAQSTPVSVPSILATPSASNNQPIESDQPLETDAMNRFPNTPGGELMVKTKMEPNTDQLIEPKTEYLDDMNNEDSVEDLTLDDDDEMPGPSHADGSNQNFSQWQMSGDRSTDEVFMAAQEAVGAHRDSQDNFVDVKSIGLDDPLSSDDASASFQERPNSANDRLDIMNYADDPMLVGEEVTMGTMLKSELRQALRESTDGKAVLHFYKTNSCLNNKMRQRLSNLIIDNELRADPNKIISHSRFAALSYVIADLFPPEKPESYFTPYCSDARGKRHNAKGKLLDRYKNMRKGLRACGLIERKHTSAPTKNNDSTSLFSGSVGEEIKWLTKSIEPWSVVEQYWKSTMEKRLHHFNNDRDSSVESYMDQYPALKEPEGYKLINLDFALKYPEIHNAFLDTWSIFTEKILDLCQNKFRYDFKFRQIVQEAHLDLFVTDETAQKVTAFYLLSFLMPKYQTCKTNSGPPWRPTRDEMKDGLLLNVKTPDEMDEALEKRKNIYEDCNLPIVPIPIIVGSPENITSCYVNYKSINYELSTPMAAIDVCFKMYQIFNLDFSPETMYAWLFVQKYVYKMTDASVMNYIPVTTLATDLFV